MNHFHDTLSLTAVATAPIAEGDLVGFNDAPVAAVDAPVKGWARNPAAVGDAVAVIAIGAFRCKAAGVITAGQIVVSGATPGTVQAAGATPANPLGRALNAATAGGYVLVLVR
ncbi:capsid cement protein [Paracoccus contaminans]|uniref:DUF2190 domain-containing protein n=1 Tax=Paracoccus contaminans TaxID=1945662 RepID=A0A1W6CYZ1_9RHOB|nr:capsid cement protein [Paracoccus contaminans]ARJ70088.1 hypothetical protein B0A89_11035 [Paracoccus contaminans]